MLAIVAEREREGGGEGGKVEGKRGELGKKGGELGKGKRGGGEGEERRKGGRRGEREVKKEGKAVNLFIFSCSPLPLSVSR